MRDPQEIISLARQGLDLSYGDGRKQEWKTASFKNNLLVLQSVIEAYAVYRAQPEP